MPSSHNMVHRLEAYHWRLAVVFSVMAVILSGRLKPDLELQILIMLIASTFIAVPHGLTDFALLRNMGQRLKPEWHRHQHITTGLALYVFLMGIFGFLWWLSPLIALCCFLLISGIHFGYQDIDRYRVPAGWRRHILSWLRGTLIIGLLIINQTETPEYFNILVEDQIFNVIRFEPVWLIFVAMNMFALIHRNIKFIIETNLLIIVFLTMPPLLSFTLYFCVWHTPRHYFEVLPDSQIKDILIKIMACICIIGVFMAVFVLTSSGVISVDKEIITIFFVPLSCLTFAHVLFEMSSRHTLTDRKRS